MSTNIEFSEVMIRMGKSSALPEADDYEGLTPRNNDGLIFRKQHFVIVGSKEGDNGWI